MSYLLATLASVIAHGLLILLILKGWEYTHPPEPPKPPAYIKATLLDLKTQGKQGAPEPKPKPKPKPPEPKVDKAEIEKKRLEKKLAEQKAQQEVQKKEQEKAKQKQVALEKAKKEKAKKEKAEKEKAEKLKKEKEKKLADERKKKAAQKLKDDLAKEQERLQAELQAEMLAQQTEDDLQLSQSYKDVIQKRITGNWKRPGLARNGMTSVIQVQFVPTGEIVGVSLVKSSGNNVFDRSVIAAANRTRKISELSNIPTRVFESDFRKVNLEFRIEGLRQ